MKRPKVSIVIPNYNHAPFLKRRLESVLGQTYRDFEVIYLDDASTDESNEIFAAYASGPRIRAFTNKVNTGIPGKQWNQGVRAARGEFIWIAESDDYADERFLELLVPQLEAHPTAGLVYCQSLIVNERDEVVGSYDRYADDLAPERWQKDFFNQGKDECSRFLLYKNTIPNASAVLFRKKIYEEAGFADEWVRYCGDWLLWVKMLMISDLVFVASPLNYHRRHEESLSHSPRRRTSIGPSAVVAPHPEAPGLPLRHELQRWPAKLRYILGRNALRANRPGEARLYFKESLQLGLTVTPLLFWAASYLGRPVYQGLDGIKSRVPVIGRLTTKLHRLWTMGHQLLPRRYPQRHSG